MISQLFILSARGDTIINRDCIEAINLLKIIFNFFVVRSDLIKTTPEMFFRNVKLWKGDAPPIFVKNIKVLNL